MEQTWWVSTFEIAAGGDFIRANVLGRVYPRRNGAEDDNREVSQ